MTYTIRKSKDCIYELDIDPTSIQCAVDAGIMISAAYERHTGHLRTPSMVSLFGNKLMKEQRFSIPMRDKSGNHVGTLHVTLRRPLTSENKTTIRSPMRLYSPPIQSNFETLKSMLSIVSMIRKLPSLILSFFRPHRSLQKNEQIELQFLDRQKQTHQNKFLPEDLEETPIRARA